MLIILFCFISFLNGFCFLDLDALCCLISVIVFIYQCQDLRTKRKKPAFSVLIF